MFTKAMRYGSFTESEELVLMYKLDLLQTLLLHVQRCINSIHLKIAYGPETTRTYVCTQPITQPMHHVH